ncbi:DNA polymerase-3 subunit delta [Breznakia sp. PF5-3]|uniref:DNA polymerase III subunit delta n=1 Tax=unclassified Breznakia TaxID=2623764 RepID=UPI002406BD86|nr:MULTISPECIES: DNA polymerase III subunit delta [unclassified Breznakia]MDL2276114.1 DNA polymerase III subunit delta [Breznakia sp. OttesenSCG-928-G09]MDF9824438.1 DNA polymerase-3 subunit delta [Breznakia sp. PM6-1]MDF9835167.1 DNA polymerase-3 subunit delta [Breznakia sp. PF5-3]MDF9838308.1 DNA polymerase-3 subunit delta [Breznakia sp. PFB2-8]MDF9860324.1 DNA polymerase-3 subunit delta [Breznakia sp. PH5-24]
MNFLLTGEEHYLLQKKMMQIIKEANVDDMNIITYDATKDDITDIVNDCNTMPFFSEHKVVIVRNCKFLSSTPLAINEEVLLNYLNEPFEPTILILIYEGKMDARKKIVKEIKKRCTPFVFQPLDEFERNNLIQQELQKRNVNMDRAGYNLFLERCGFDIAQIQKELDKFEVYGDLITYDVVKELIPKPIDDNVFLLSQAMFDHNVKKCFSYVEDLKKANVEVIALIGMLASQFRFLSEVKVLSNMNKGKREIASELGAHPYRVEKTLEQAYRSDLKQIRFILNELANLDQKIKLGLVDKQLGFETFLVKYCI